MRKRIFAKKSKEEEAKWLFSSNMYWHLREHLVQWQWCYISNKQSWMEFLCKFHPLHLSATLESNHPEWGSPLVSARDFEPSLLSVYSLLEQNLKQTVGWGWGYFSGPYRFRTVSVKTELILLQECIPVGSVPLYIPHPSIPTHFILHPLPPWTERCLWKHYLPHTLYAVGKNPLMKSS